MKSRLNSGNACNHSAQSIPSSRLLLGVWFQFPDSYAHKFSLSVINCNKPVFYVKRTIDYNRKIVYVTVVLGFLWIGHLWCEYIVGETNERFFSVCVWDLEIIVYILSSIERLKVWIFVLKMSLSAQNTSACGSNLMSELSKYFGHQQFKSDLQRQATEAVLRSKNKHWYYFGRNHRKCQRQWEMGELGTSL
jgi:hypothetical protein